MIILDERYLSAPLNKYVQAFCCSGLEDPEISNIYNGILWWLNERLLNKNLDHDDLTLFKIVKFELCGSFADGTRIKEDELEFDLLAEVSTHNFSFSPSSTCPGYVHQVLASTSNPQQISDDFIHLISSHLPDCFSVVLENDRVQLRYSGRSHTKIIIDIHPVVITRFSASSELYYVIPVSCKQPEHECWRISHFKTEMNLLRNARRHHILSFRILKELRRVLLPYGLELYAKYALKTAVCLHECSCTSNVDSDVKSCTLSILDIMFDGYRLGYLQSIVGGINIFDSIESNFDTSTKAQYISSVREILRDHFDNTSTTLCMLWEQLCQPRSPPVFAKETGHETSFSVNSKLSQNGLETGIPVSAQQAFEKKATTAFEILINTPGIPVNIPQMPADTSTAPMMPLNAANTSQIPENHATTPRMMEKSVSAPQIQANPAISPTIPTKTATSQNTVITPQMLLNTSTPAWMTFNNATNPPTWTDAPSIDSDAASPWRPIYSPTAPHLQKMMSTTNVKPVYDSTPYQIPSQFAAGHQTPVNLSFPFYMPVNNVFGTFMPRYNMVNTGMLVFYASVPDGLHLIPLNIGIGPQYCSYSVPTPQAPWFVG